MKTSLFSLALRALLPATVLLASCGKDDEPAAPAPDQGKVLVSHAAAAANTTVTVFVNDQQGGQLNYGQTGTYFNINSGTPTLSVKNGTQVVASKPLTVAKDQNYSAFVYSPTATIGSADLLVVSDDLSAPATGTAKVRLVHLGVGAASPVRLTVPAATPGGPTTDLTPDVAFGTASPFAAINAGPFNLSVTTGTAGNTTRTPVIAVGDGTGAGTGSKTFEAGKIYTILVRGISGSGVPIAQQTQVVITQNN
ncbi:DUF4397 domain-containing protein [Hymenobacter ruricola]|uniref:DUF4397 domain-containing protein n=1 Tax=Hymenobacter ruricola TaxID=2791023 RepID=A0ABS0I7W7_9BACT|nr:DUF4397 domain-containing protein [Hymenobacter ruricola]MBF9222614.1 DUF4397 domain-containing protein [Hymenobacter ruricola]